ncbi:MAG: aldose epimerase family protein [Chitinophagales bacterium]
MQRSYVVIAVLILNGWMASCNQPTQGEAQATDSSGRSPAIRIASIPFGSIDSNAVTRYDLISINGMLVSVLNYGGVITQLNVPDRNGNLGDVVLGFDSLSGFLQNNNPYFGALVGRYGNRIANARFVLDGKTYSLAANNGKNSLHGGSKGFDKKIWKATAAQTDSTASLKLEYFSKDGEEGFPGNLLVTVIYTLTMNNELKIEYAGKTDKPTPVNLTNHSYFNLSAGRDSTQLSQEILLNADRYTVVNEQLIPTGSLASVKGTPMDFTQSKKMGTDIGKVRGGYDHNYVLNKKGSELSLAATVYDAPSGRVMEMFTTEPGVQFYTGNFLDGTLIGKRSIRYVQHAGFCLEAQHFPDSPNQPSFPNCILRPGETYHQLTVYKFSTR